MFKNVSGQKIKLFAFDVTTGLPKTGDAANLTAYVSKDSGSVTVLGDTSATEMSSTNAPGWYLFDLTQAETNADDLLFTGKSSTGDVVLVASGIIFTTPPLSALFSGMTSLPQWLGLLAGKQAANSTALTEIRATGAGSGTYDPTTDSTEALKDDQMDAADLETSVQTVIEDNHLDHLLAVTYDPASKPGAADALLNELVESDGGVARYTANALEQAPSGTGASAASIRAEMDANSTQLAKLGTPAGASISADIAAVKAQTAAIETDTAEIGAAGAGLTNINLPNQTMDIVGNITGNLSGSVGSVTGAVGSVTGAVGSVTGNVGGNVVGSIGSLGATAASNVRTQAGNALADYGAIP